MADNPSRLSFQKFNFKIQLQFGFDLGLGFSFKIQFCWKFCFETEQTSKPLLYKISVLLGAYHYG